MKVIKKLCKQSKLSKKTFTLYNDVAKIKTKY